MPTGTPLKIKAPLGLPPVPIPAADPPTTETVGLGRGLYYDPLFSGATRSRVHPAILRNRVYRHSPSLDWRRRQKTYAALADRHQLRL